MVNHMLILSIRISNSQILDLFLAPVPFGVSVAFDGGSDSIFSCILTPDVG